MLFPRRSRQLNATPRPRAARRIGQLAALTAAVLPAHLWLAATLLPPQLGTGAADQPRRIDVAFVHELAPQAPPAAPPQPVRPRRLAAAAPAPAASAAAAQPLPAVAAADAADDLRRETMPALAPALPEAPAVAASAPAPTAAASAASAAGFEWPPSTRLSYTLEGHWRGPLLGWARVEWLRAGSRYQVHLDVSAGLFFGRRSSSEGEITADGLSPRRYDEVTHLPLMADRRVAVEMGSDSVRFDNGREVPRPPGLQDSVSQFVQLTWLSTLQPQWLATPGRTVSLPVALPRRVEAIVYEVVQTDTVQTPAGPVDAVHVRPVTPAKAGDLAVEFWVAPALQYLPVRVLIRQDAQSWVDLLIDRLPEQAAPGK